MAIYSAIDPPGSAIFGGFGGSALHGSGLNANQRAVGILGGLVVAGQAGLAAFLASPALRSRARASSDGVDPWEPSSSSAPVQEPPGNGR